MTITVTLPPEKEAAFKAEAESRGLSLEEWMLDIAGRSIPTSSLADLQRTSPREWARHFDTWVDSHDVNTPVLSDAAMSRETIYPDRI